MIKTAGIKEGMAATYVQISREDLEQWLDTLGMKMPWKRQPNRAGIYLLPLSPVVAIKLSSTIGSKDDAMGVGKASMQLSLVSTVTGQTLNKKAQGQGHFKRTTNWRATWKDGIERMEAAYVKAKGFYDALAVIEDRDQYKADIIQQIEAVPGWDRNSMLSDFHANVSRGGILTEKQKGALDTFANKAPKAKEPLPKGRAVWALEGGPSGEEVLIFEVVGNNKVVLEYKVIDDPRKDISEISFAEAAKVWNDADKHSFWYPSFGNPESDPPFLKAPGGDQALIERVRNLYREAHKTGDQWLMDFATNIGQALKSGRTLSPKQMEVLEKNLQRRRLASKSKLLPKGRALWSLEGGASGEEALIFEVVGNNKVVLEHNRATADFPVGEFSEISFAEAAKIWNATVRNRDWVAYYGNPESEPPFLKTPGRDRDLIERVRNLYREAYKTGDQWLLDFATNIGKALKAGRPLTPKQMEVLEKNLQKRRLASMPISRRVAARYLNR
jgi:hypothetical protein